METNEISEQALELQIQVLEKHGLNLDMDIAMCLTRNESSFVIMRELFCN